MTEHISLSTHVLLTPLRSGLRAGEDNVVEVLVRIQAPEAPAGHAAERPAQSIALVIDRSGSMAGRPLEEAKRCAEYVLGKLRPTDAVALVDFDNRVRRLWPAAPIGDGTSLRTAITGIQAGGNTNLHGGWRNGAESLVDLPGSGLKRVILLSDGQANEGLTDPAAISFQCGVFAGRGVTTSTYGLGNHFNEDLMIAMARAGGGNQYYGDSAEDLIEPFERELALLGNLCLRDLHLSASAPDGVALKMLNDLPAVNGGWRLPELAWGAEAWAILRLLVPAGALPAPGQLLPVLRVSITGLSLEGEPVQLERAGLALPTVSAAGFDALPEDQLVARRLVELAAARALAGVRAAAAAEDWQGVDRLLEDAGRRFAGNEWVTEILRAMQNIASSRSRERVMKEARFTTTSLNSRLVAPNESIRFCISSEAGAVPAYLRRKSVQGKRDL